MSECLVDTVWENPFSERALVLVCMPASWTLKVFMRYQLSHPEP